MTALPAMTVTWTAAAILGNLIGGGALAESALYGLPVTFVSNVPAENFVVWDGRSERVPPVVGYIAPDGTLKRNGDPVKLLANNSGLNVTGLQWTCLVNGMEEFTFDALTDGASLDLSTVVAVPNVPVVGVSEPFTTAEKAKLSTLGLPVVVISASATLVAGRHYINDSLGPITLTFPSADLTPGAIIRITNLHANTGYTDNINLVVAGGGYLWVGQDGAPNPWPMPGYADWVFMSAGGAVNNGWNGAWQCVTQSDVVTAGGGWAIADPVNPAKRAQFDVSSLTAVRTYSFPDADTALGGDVAAVTHAAASKTTPIGADAIPLVDSAAGNILKQLSITDLKALIYAYIVGAAPGTLDTLVEIATALGNDANFAATMTTLLAGKAPNSRSIATTAPLTGGGDLSANRTLALTTSPTGQTPVGVTRSIATSAPITGGGDLSADRTLGLSGTLAQFNTACTDADFASLDANNNVLADAFIPTKESTVTAAATTTLTINNAQIQEFTGSSTQTVKLPTTGITEGMSYTVVNNSTGTVTVQSSGANTLLSVATARVAIFTAVKDTPTGAFDWMVTGLFVSTSSAFTSLMARDSNANAFADCFISTVTSTVTAAGTKTLTVADTAVQEFTGTTTHTLKLPTTSVTQGMMYIVTNNSSGVVTVQSSGGNNITGGAVAANSTVLFVAQVATPTTAAHWRAI